MISPYQYALIYSNLRVPLDAGAIAFASVYQYQNPGPNWKVKAVPDAHWQNRGRSRCNSLEKRQAYCHH
jgi:hypothetical protein